MDYFTLPGVYRWTDGQTNRAIHVYPYFRCEGYNYLVHIFNQTELNEIGTNSTF